MSKYDQENTESVSEEISLMITTKGALAHREPKVYEVIELPFFLTLFLYLMKAIFNEEKITIIGFVILP